MTRDYAFETVDVFTEERFGGNPLAVLTEAEGLSEREMQAIAREFNLSETTFVTKPRDPAHTASVRIFTPVTELPFAGHPNIGTALVLAAREPAAPSRYVFEEAAGLVALDIDLTGHPSATLTAPRSLQIEGELPPDLCAAACGLAAEAVLTRQHRPCIAGVGTPFVLMEVTDDARRAASPDLAAMREAASRHPVRPVGFPVFLYSREGGIIRGRMFSPLSGIHEDPATGSAAAALAALLTHQENRDALDVVIYQGVEMGRPSELRASGFRSGTEVFGRVGGGAVPVSRGTIRL